MELKKLGKPISFFRGTEPSCCHVERIVLNNLWRCINPKNKANALFNGEPCSSLDWDVCCFNPNNPY